jgi:hypothetical protein
MKVSPRPLQAANLLGMSTQPGFCACRWAWSVFQAPASSQSLGHEHPARLLRMQMGVECVSGPCKQPISWARAPSPAFAHADGRGVCFRPLQAANLLGTSTQPGFCACRWAWSVFQAPASSQSLGHEHPDRPGYCARGVAWGGSGSVCPNFVTPGLRTPRVSAPGFDHRTHPWC